MVSSPDVGLVITEQKPAINHIGDLLSGIDHFYEQNLSGDNVTFKLRYDANTYPSDFSISAPQMVSKSVTRTGSEEREQQYIVEYNKDQTNSQLSSRVKSNFGYLSEFDVREISTSLTNESDADYIAGLISRDSSANGVYSKSLIGVGLGFGLDDSGIESSADIPKNRPSIIQKITESIDNNQTNITSKILLRS